MKKIVSIFIFLLCISFFTIHFNTHPQSNCTSGKCSSHISPCQGYPYLAHRSQGVNLAREMVGWQAFMNKDCMDEIYESFYTAFEYTRTFKPDRLAEFYFGSDLVNCNTLLIQGSKISNRDPRAWLADYFGLPQDFESKVSFFPRIENFIVDFGFYIGLDKWRKGLYFRVHAPIAHTRWDLNMCEHDVKKTSSPKGFADLYMWRDFDLQKQILPSNFKDAITEPQAFGDMQESLKFGLMSDRRLTKTRPADIQIIFGYNPVLREKGHFGINLQLSCPTGNRPCARYLFEPIVGNGGHWELGGGITSSWIFWRSCEYADKYFGLYFDANLTHFFKTCQTRSFDFCCKPSCRYMLLCEMGENVNGLAGGPSSGDVTLACCQYKGNLIPAIHYTTLNVDVKIKIQADIALKFAYTSDN